MSILIFIVILVVLILVHEFGHFIVAKWVKMRVDEFGIGFPPKVAGWKPKGSETEYSFNWIPFGGFVKIYGEDPVRADPDTTQAATGHSGPDGSASNGAGPEYDERAFVNKPKWAQAAVIVAGVVFNVLLAWLLISATFMSGAPSPVAAAPAGASVENARLTIVEVVPNSPADQSDVRVGDVVTAISAGGEFVDELTPETMSAFISAHPDAEITINLNRADEALEKRIMPVSGIVGVDGKAIGVALSTIGTVSMNPLQALYEGGKTTVALTRATLLGFWGIITSAFTGSGPALSSLTGPVGIVGLVGDAADFGFIYLLSFTAFISINLAIINMIPFPALDGGRLLFIIIEAIKGSPMRPAVANTANSIGFLLLIILMAVVTYNDIIRIIGG